MEKTQEESTVNPPSEKQIASSKRMQLLSKKVSEAIKQADEEIEGEFTLLEIIHVMNQNVAVYCRHGLKQEYS